MIYPYDITVHSSHLNYVVFFKVSINVGIKFLTKLKFVEIGGNSRVFCSGYSINMAYRLLPYINMSPFIFRRFGYTMRQFMGNPALDHALVLLLLKHGRDLTNASDRWQCTACTFPAVCMNAFDRFWTF